MLSTCSFFRWCHSIDPFRKCHTARAKHPLLLSLIIKGTLWLEGMKWIMMRRSESLNWKRSAILLDSSQIAWLQIKSKSWGEFEGLLNSQRNFMNWEAQSLLRGPVENSIIWSKDKDSLKNWIALRVRMSQLSKKLEFLLWTHVG